MVATFAILGFLLFVSGVVRAIQAHSNGRENYATACGAFALFGLGLVIAPMFMKRQPVVPEAVAATPVVSEFEVKQAAKTAARQMGEAAVRAALLEPSSARFSSQFEVLAQGGFYVSCGMVTGRNSFGGYAPMKRYYTIGPTAIVESVEFSSAFENDFRSYCMLPDLTR
ncbi:hypothetical protein ABID82_005172 [Methylobacterium sp. PvP062]|uniref:Uncharacterized protein n=1 Tax=Methylobacterium radiotolerans TaxID=31998 RepID=A0ABV2NU63_9HYPH|nr:MULTISPECIES: hypothetical protein [unclassified Methylobacterium]MBP2498281.1 hypothetical protein [Methylobacterium sp. PvP105]MBP2505665.1 hypothetical protein [Methylobacterium sp. PvP109]